jgi:hypothetical protein
MSENRHETLDAIPVSVANFERKNRTAVWLNVVSRFLEFAVIAVLVIAFFDQSAKTKRLETIQAESIETVKQLQQENHRLILALEEDNKRRTELIKDAAVEVAGLREDIDEIKVITRQNNTLLRQNRQVADQILARPTPPPASASNSSPRPQPQPTPSPVAVPTPPPTPPPGGGNGGGSIDVCAIFGICEPPSNPPLAILKND